MSLCCCPLRPAAACCGHSKQHSCADSSAATPVATPAVQLADATRLCCVHAPAGKSTALKILAGKLKPNLGRFDVSGLRLLCLLCLLCALHAAAVRPACCCCRCAFAQDTRAPRNAEG